MGGGEWLLRSPLHVAAYSGDKERLLEILETSESDDDQHSKDYSFEPSVLLQVMWMKQMRMVALV